MADCLVTNQLSEKQEKIISNTIQEMKGLSFREAEEVLFQLMNKIKTDSLISA